VVPQERDPRYRPYRFALWVAYFLATLLSIGALVANVAHHLSGPHRPSASSALPTRVTLRVCMQELEALQREQSERAWRLAGEIGAGDALVEFDRWSREWEQRVEDLSERCRLDVSDPPRPGFAGREELARARDAVLALHRAYRAQVNRFAAEGAELARGAARALGAARLAVEPKP
jgi:hypothetical protein